MTKTYITLLSLLFGHCSSAASHESPIRINTTYPTYATSELNKLGKVTLDDGSPAWGLGLRGRNEIYRKAGLEPVIAQLRFDEVEKDVLLDQLKTKPHSELTLKYPRIPTECLKKARELILKSMSSSK